MSPRTNFARVAVLIAVPALCLTFYAWSPWRATSWNPFARVLGIDLLRMPSPSMEPTIKIGQILVASGWPYLGEDPAVGDVVVFGYPPDPTVRYAKRIVATGGSTVSVSKCRAIVDGRLINEPYAATKGDDPYGMCEFNEVRVPDGKYFVLSDNRTTGADSRAWGFVPRENIYGPIVSQ